VILDEPREIVVEGVEAGGGENARLPHRAAEHPPSPPGPHDPGVTAGDQAPDRTSEPLR